MLEAPARPDDSPRPAVSDPGEAVLLEVGGAPFLFPRRIEERVALVFRGKYDFGTLPDMPKARRMLDLGAEVGQFACWAWRRWRGSAWVDCYESNPDLHAFLKHNLPPGGAMHPTPVRDSAASAALPACDVLKLEADGNEAAVLRGYRYQPSVVCFEWHREQDRLEIEQTLASWGLRCFRLAFKHADYGHQTWVRSAAIWSDQKNGFVLP